MIQSIELNSEGVNALNVCYYRYNIAAFADFETSCKRYYQLQQRLLNCNEHGLSLLDLTIFPLYVSRMFNVPLETVEKCMKDGVIELCR